MMVEKEERATNPFAILQMDEEEESEDKEMGEKIDEMQVAQGALRQGALEGSNVNIVEELVDMIETQRAYEVNSKMIKATDEMLQYANQNM